MQKENHRPVQSKNEQMSILQFHGRKIVFEVINGQTMINATQMAKPFGKTPKDWLRTQQAKELVNVVAARHICLASDLQVVRNGGKNYGTFFQEDVALFFAQWLSPEFYLACNAKLKEIVANKALVLLPYQGVTPLLHDGELLYNYKEVVSTLGGSVKASTSRRKLKFPQHFKMIYGRNFITATYFDLLKGYYSYRNASNQLKLSI